MGATSHDVHVDWMLSEMAIDYRPEGAIANEIFPTVSVQHQSNLYPVFDRSQYLKRQNTSRAPGTMARQIHREVGTGTYFCKNYALSTAVTIEDRSNADPIFVTRLYEGGAQFCLDHLLLDWEIRVASLVTSGTNVGSYSAVSSAWTGDGGNPLANMNQGIDNVHYANGVHPTDAVYGTEAWKSWRRHSTVRNLIFGVNNGGGYPSLEQTAELLGLKRVHIGAAFRDNSGLGLPESLDTIWGDNVLIFYRPDGPAIDRPSFAYNFRWARPGLPNMAVERHPYDSRTKSELVEVGYYQDEKVTGKSYSFLLVAVNSST